MDKSEFLDVRNKSTDEAARTLNPEDTRAEALEKREDARRAERPELAAHNERKAEEARQLEASIQKDIAEEKAWNAKIANMSKNEAESQAVFDLGVYSDYARDRDDFEEQGTLLLMGEKAKLNASYAEALEAAEPGLLKKIEAAEQGAAANSVNVGALYAKQSEPTLETYEAAVNDVSSFMATKPEDAAARAEIAAKMQERGDDAGYVTALKRITPDLHTLTEEHTPALREEHYRVEQAAQKSREAEQSPPPLSSEARMSDAQMKAENATIAQEAKKRGELPGKLDLGNPEDRDFAEKMASAARDEAANNKANTVLALDNLMDAQESRKSLAKDDYIVPRSVANKYEQVDGKFFSKDEKSPRLMFEDKGKALATSGTDRAAIADMVTLAKAKQWDSLSLSGSQEFRREAWLQAESQGIKTKGYTPKEQDLAQLQALTQQRQVNTIQPIAERGKAQEAETRTAPRHDINKNQAALVDGAMKLRSSNMQELSTMKQFQGMSAQDLGKVAFWRGMVQEQTKTQPKSVRDASVAHFDKEMQDPNKVKQLPDPALKETGKAQIKERTQERNSHEQELGR